ncbi:IclR family transcriptional regulator [Nocardia sp. 348MFTsu5.1]|uniref:IclR family transcriptional regulator n=1 Tax=Nocardia sp. 348MFTsu5.1 TaxID=1172185 RepID=UPI00036C79D8|nr:IclR family transcriptional regulator [Nocardia sp. 348MFTsu5.1]
MEKSQKSLPTYAIASVDSALRLATVLQLEGELTVAEAAERLGVARSTAHRLLQMLVYRDFAVQYPGRQYGAGPVLQLAEHSRSATSRLRSVALPHMERLVQAVDESANLTIRTGTEVRFIASVESGQALRVGSREGMVFAADRTSGGMLLLAEMSDEELDAAYSVRDDAEPAERPDLARLRSELARIRKQRFAVNQGRSERGVVAVGVPVCDSAGKAVAALSVSIPSVRYDRQRLPSLVATLRMGADGIASDLAHRL